MEIVDNYDNQDEEREQKNVEEKKKSENKLPGKKVKLYNEQDE